jgi:ribosome biogenesis GTPase A
MSLSKQIQWYPGHMFKSMREIKEKLPLVDLVIVLLDARLPQSSMNPKLFQTIKDKPTIILFNKSDLADPKMMDVWQNIYNAQGFQTLRIDASSGHNVHKIHALALEVLKDKLARENQKGLKLRPLRAMILGIPNVGKSTLINQLIKRKATKTANRPGVTKAQQWIKIGEQFELLDTPGVLWPKFDDPKVGYHLAITGAIKDHILPIDDVLEYAIEFLKTHYQGRLNERYQIDEKLSYEQILNAIALKRGALLKGFEIDLDRVYQIILTDLRNKHLGGLSFDRP